LKSHKTAKALAIITLTKVTPELDRPGQAGEISAASPYAGPGEHEIEVTPDMIAAGGLAIWAKMSHDPYCSPSLAEDLAEVAIRSALERDRKRS